MKTQRSLLLSLFLIAPFCLPLFAQNTAVPWSAFDMGFSTPSMGNTAALSVAGQSFVGQGMFENTDLFAGFLFGTQTLVGVREEQQAPLEFRLYQNYPNPFNPSTTVMFDLPRMVRVSIRLYNVLGQEVATLVDEVKEAGHHSFVFDAAKLASGAYFYRIIAGQFVSVKKLMIVR